MRIQPVWGALAVLFVGCQSQLAPPLFQASPPLPAAPPTASPAGPLAAPPPARPARPSPTPSPSVGATAQPANNMSGGGGTPQPTPTPFNTDFDTRKLFVTFLPWYRTAPHWDHWKWQDHDPDVVLPGGQRQISAAHYPQIGPYDSKDEAVIGYQLLLMKAAGFDAPSLNWYSQGNSIDEGTRSIVATMERWNGQYGLGMAFTIMVDAEPYRWMNTDAEQLAALTDDLAYVLEEFGESPAYQQLDHKPVVFFFAKPDLAIPAQSCITPAEWLTVRNAISTPFWLNYNHLDSQFQATADLAYGWIEDNDPTGQEFGEAYLDWLYPTFAWETANHGWALPVDTGIVFPGFDDAGVYAWTLVPGTRRWIDRSIGGQSTFTRTWDKVDAHNLAHPEAPVNWVMSATWNDWNEGSEIEPSVENGRSALELAAARNHLFKGTVAPPADAWDFADQFLALRRQGHSEASLAGAIRLFAQGDYAAALAALPAP